MTSPPQRHGVATVPPSDGAVVVERHPEWVSLFNSARYHELNLSNQQRAVRLSCSQDGRELGSISGVITDDRFVNGHSAPFGGVDLARDRETPANVDAVVVNALRQLEELGVAEAEIRMRPTCYSASEQLVLFTLLNHGFAVARSELNQHIDLEGLDSAEAYLATLRSPARRALKHLADQGFTLHEADTEAEWDRCYAILSANRAAKDRALSLSRDYVARARAALSPRVRMFELRTPDGPCAAALTYRVVPGRELVVAWGDSGHALERSPMNMVALRMVERAIGEGVGSLDLGISNEPDPVAPVGVNAGLVQFKQSVGARTEARLRLTRRIG